MDKESLKSNPLFKSIITNLKRKYPFIIGYRLPINYDELIDKYEPVIFVDLVVSLPKFVEYMNNEIEYENFVLDYFKYNDELKSSGLRVPFTDKNADEIKDVTENIENDVSTIIKNYSDVMDSEHKLRRTPVIHEYITKL